MRDFIKYTLATFTGLILFLTLGIAGLAVLLVAIANSAKDTGPQVANHSILTFDLSQQITDSSRSTDPGTVIGATLSGNNPGNSVSIHTVLESLRQAAKDDRISGLYLYGNVSSTGLGSGLATLQEVRQALEAFRKAGKPIYAYDNEGWKEKDYYLASVANTIFLSPSSTLEVNGFSSETMFLGGALQKYGIGVQTIRVGKFKSAVEPYTRTAMSPESREETQQLLNDLWNEFLTAVAQSGRSTPQKLQAIADNQGLLLPDQAKSNGLIDKIAYEDEVATELQHVTGEQADNKPAKAKKTDTAELFRQISLPEYAESGRHSSQQASDRRIAVVYAEGDIVSGSGGPGSVGGDDLAELLRKLRQDQDIKAIVLRVNSPGGSATASAQIAREVALAAKQKPVITSMGSYAASGGYEISAPANRIFASPGTITGSIGVFGQLPNFQAIANQNGITWDRVKTGRYADSETIARPKTPQELAIGQHRVESIYDQFLTLVSESRNLPKAKVAEVAQGRVWSGAAAEKVGLVDQMGGLDAAIQEAAKEAKLGDDWKLEEYPKSRSFVLRLGRLLSSQLPHTSAPSDPISQELAKIQSDLDSLRSMNDPQGIYSRLPFDLKID